ncbi:MAG: hypothetical protein FE834_06870 [Gammaproteobacteria bacterium]|nr:hypothetical protein [Gammaproteobacteria bacterium]
MVFYVGKTIFLVLVVSTFGFGYNISFMNKNLKEIVAVIPAPSIKKIIRKNGLKICDIPKDFIIKNSQAYVRYDAEQIYDVIQLVSVFVIHNSKKILIHKRSKRLPEKRLHEEYSTIFGGHILMEDLCSLFDPFDVKNYGFITRELYEEVDLKKIEEIKPVGLLYDDSRDISKQHLGLVFSVKADLKDYQIKEKGFFIKHSAESINNLKNNKNFDNWSKIIIKNIGKII